jgi:predicted deacylase
LQHAAGGGDLLATITSVFGELVEEIRAPIAGPIVRIATSPPSRRASG